MLHSPEPYKVFFPDHKLSFLTRGVVFFPDHHTIVLVPEHKLSFSARGFVLADHHPDQHGQAEEANVDHRCMMLALGPDF